MLYENHITYGYSRHYDKGTSYEWVVTHYKIYLSVILVNYSNFHSYITHSLYNGIGPKIGYPIRNDLYLPFTIKPASSNWGTNNYL
jgi:hypothetical protein